MTSFHRFEGLPSWRVMALHAWSRPSDPTVYGVIDVDAEPAQRYVARLRESTGLRVTSTHVVGKAAAVAIAERPEVNAIVRRGACTCATRSTSSSK